MKREKDPQQIRSVMDNHSPEFTNSAKNSFVQKKNFFF